MTRKAGRDADGPRGRLYADADPMHLPCDGVDAERAYEPGWGGGGEDGDNDEVADRFIDARPPTSSRSQDLEGQATVKPFLMFVFESVSGGNDCTRGVDPDGLSGRRAHTCARTPLSARRGERLRGILRKEVQESRCRGHPVTGHQRPRCLSTVSEAAADQAHVIG